MMSLIRLSTFSFLLATASLCVAQSRTLDADALSGSVSLAQWEVCDISFRLENRIDEPFARQVDAIVTDAAGRQRVPLFFNGDDQWVLRYSSSTVGEKSYVVESEIEELDGRRGSFAVSKNSRPDRHGGVVLKGAIPNRFFYEDGTHYLNLAFECDWLFALDYGAEDIQKTKHLLSLLKRHRFNQVVMNVYSYDVRWPKDERLSNHPEHEYGGREDIFPFLGSNSHPDFTSLNVDYFKHFDKVISEMHDQEIASHLMIYVWNKLVSWPEMNSKADNLYYDYVIKRYQAFPNIIWDVSKEALHHQRATREYILERIERTRQLDSFNRLVSVHDYGFCRNNSDSVDFISMQNWRHTLYQHMMDAAEEFPNKPIFNIEHGGYEESPYVVFPGAYTNADVCLARNYMCLFAGGYTTYYWQGASWNVVIHNPFEQPDEFIKPKFSYFTQIARLCDLIQFQDCKPAPRFNSSGYCLINRKAGIAAIYTPKGNHYVGSSSLMKEFDCEAVTRQWFNTLTGELTEPESYDMKGLGFWEDRPWRYKADTVLIIRGLKPLRK